MVFTSLVHLVDQLSVYTISLSHTKVFDKWNLQGKCSSWTDLFLEAGYGEEQYYIFHLLPCCLPLRAPFHFSECAHSMKKPTRNQDWYCHKYFFLSKNKVNITKYQPAQTRDVMTLSRNFKNDNEYVVVHNYNNETHETKLLLSLPVRVPFLYSECPHSMTKPKRIQNIIIVMNISLPGLNIYNLLCFQQSTLKYLHIVVLWAFRVWAQILRNNVSTV